MRYTSVLATSLSLTLCVACSDPEPTPKAEPKDMGSQDMAVKDKDMRASNDLGAPDMRATEEMDASDLGADMPEDMGPTPPAITPDNFVELAAKTYCETLFRCCDGQSQELLLGSLKGTELYKPVADELPLTQESCPTQMAKVFELKPFGDWLAKTSDDGGVSFDAEGAKACFDALTTASCGEQAIAALNDSSCLYPFFPAEGPQDRKMFKRTKAPGQSCLPLNDGFSGRLYGTCDPSLGFCCYENAQGSCGLVPDPNKTHVCKDTSAVTQRCSFDVNAGLQLCQKGLSCNESPQGGSSCDLPIESIIAQLGEPCATSLTRQTATCERSWCDVGGSNKCEPFKALGDSCAFPYECSNNYCVQGKCGDLSFYCAGPAN